MTQHLLEGSVVDDRYVIESRLAEGGFGEIFRAFDRYDSVTVAIKTVLPDALERDDATPRLLREARLAQSLTHPSTVRIYSVGTLVDGRPYVVMELLRGAPLSAVMQDQTTLDADAVVTLLRDVLGSLAEAHDKGIVHRDIKPDNLFVCDDGRVKVLDFGMSMAVAGDWGDTTAEQLTKTGWIGGTVDYMAPEFFEQTSHISPTVDVYAVGCVAFRALTGRAPFHGGTMTAVAMRHLNDPVPPLPDGTPPALEAPLMRSLSKDPYLRFSNGAEMLAALPDLPEARPWTELVHTPLPVPEGETSLVAQPGAPAPRVVIAGPDRRHIYLLAALILVIFGFVSFALVGVGVALLSLR